MDEFRKTRDNHKNKLHQASNNTNEKSRRESHMNSTKAVNSAQNHKEEEVHMPTCTEAQKVLLCLDYLRSFRRNNTKSTVSNGMHQDYITLAIWALSRSFVQPEELVLNDDDSDDDDDEMDAAMHRKTSTSTRLLAYGNDPYFQHELAATVDGSVHGNANSKGKTSGSVAHFLTDEIVIPSLQQMQNEIMYNTNPNKVIGKNNGRDDASFSDWYKYNDLHYSNNHRFYPQDGLGSEPLDLSDILQKGLEGMNAKSRMQGEEIMKADRMFIDFMDAVRSKGFFEISEQDALNYENGNGNGVHARQMIYKERYQKVVSKFRQKLVENGLQEDFERKLQLRNDGSTAASTGPGSVGGGSSVHHYDDEATVTGSVVGAMETAKENGTLKLDDNEGIARKLKGSTSTSTSAAELSRRRMSMAGKASRKEIEEAEKAKLEGNALMQQKKYQEAKDCYTRALEIVPSGPTSHVYYSNRAAALLSMRNFTEAVWDAERSVALKPDYPKAYARLGLAQFLLGQYREAVEAYSMAVKFEPNNETSVSYLDRSKKKLAMMNDDDGSVNSRNSRRSSRSGRRQSKSRNGSRRSSVAVSKNTSQYAPVDSSDDERKSRSSLRKGGRPSTANFEGRSEGDQDDPSVSLSRRDADSIANDKLDEANRLKVDGNKAMARKEYAEAIKLYSQALKMAPAGPQSHVYFSNRAAALCYLERYEEAELDAERALALDPEFGKAHARLGLARYFLRDYDGAVEAYECAAEHDPDNESNRIYLAKAKLKLGRRQSMAANKSRE